MESNYRNKEFEHYIKQNADQYRMFPSDKVWKGVNNALHTRRKWYGFWLGFLLLLTGGAVTWVMTTQPASKKENTPVVVINNSVTPAPADKSVVTEKTAEAFTNLLPFTKAPVTQPGSLVTETDGDVITTLPLVILNNLQEEITTVSQLTQKEFVQPFKNTEALTARITANPGILSFPGLLPAGIENYHGNIKQVDNAVENNSINSGSRNPYSPFTIESVANSFQHTKAGRKKMSWQLFITPTVSYRKLSVNKSSDNTSAATYPFASLDDVNSAVIHKPDLGLQIGVSGAYPITQAFRLRAGFQFNINRYDIRAYAFNGEVATIDLNGGNGNNSISTWTYYRNYAGYKSDWLKNYYFSVSVPVGAELKLFGNKKRNFGIAGTLQPTYILKDRAYLISTDYKNYAEVPRLVRHVNLNTSFETFVNYTSGKTKWQIGPQVRYQLLSSFHNKYPIKENLFDFGVKVGVTLNE